MDKIMEWLEPSIEKKAEEVVVVCQTQNNKLYSEFYEILDTLKKHRSEMNVDLNRMEDIFLRQILVVETAYRIGLTDGISLSKYLR